MEFTKGSNFFLDSWVKDSSARCNGPDPASTIAAAKEDASEPYAVLDIEEECWKLSKAMSNADFAKRMSFWQKVIDIYNQYAPNTKFGFYSEPPRNFVAAQHGINSAAYQEWEAEVDRQTALFEGEKAIFPSLYLFSDDIAANRRYVDTMISKSRELAGPGKKVIPLVWPKYHKAAYNGLAGQQVSGDVWRAELEDIKAAGADGVIIWTQNRPWAPQANSTWWAQTQDFLACLGTSTPPAPSPGTCAGQAVTIAGTPQDDTIKGTSGPDVIAGLGGNDEIRSKGGADIVCGGDGDDDLYSGSGNDQLFGDSGDDRLSGRGGVDQCNGGAHTRGDQLVDCEQTINVPSHAAHR